MNHNQPGNWHCAFCRGKLRLSKLDLLVAIVGSACIGAFVGAAITTFGGG